jgi:hypothetical protein
MGADAGIHIRIKGIDKEEPVQIPDIGTGDDFFFLLKEGLSHNLNFKLTDETFNEIKGYNFVEDKISPMLEGEPDLPDFRSPNEILRILELIQKDTLRKIKSKEIVVNEQSQLYLINLFEIIGGLKTACNYSNYLEQEIAIVYEWF